jgi:HSP20 family molecular chaperone IbpA
MGVTMGDLDWRALRELAALRSRLGEILARALIPEDSALPAQMGSFEPPVDVWETDAEVVVEVEVPSALASGIDVKLEGKALVVSGNISQPHGDDGHYLRVERPRGSFCRIIPLPVAVDGSPSARLHRGVLEVRLPRAHGGRRRIEIARGQS